MFMDLLVVLTADEKMTVIEGGEVSNPCMVVNKVTYSVNLSLTKLTYVNFLQ